jgi:PAS domain S-box-containing protein
MTVEEVSTPEENSRLVDEVEQLTTSLEAAQDEISSLAAERDRLRLAMDRLASDLKMAWKAGSSAEAEPEVQISQTELERERASQTEEELRAAFEELQVLTEELEVSNTTLRQANIDLDERVAERTSALVTVNEALSESEARFRTLIEGMPQLVWRSEALGNWTWSSPQWSEFTGLSVTRSLGQGWLDALHPEDRPNAELAWFHAEATKDLLIDARIFNAEEGRFRHFRTRAMPVLGPEGSIIEWLGTSTDVNDITELQERQGVLLAELQHRTRNLMSVVRSVVGRTLRGSDTLEDFAHRVEPRLAALSRVQGVLSRKRERERITVSTLVKEELAAHVDLDGESAGSRILIEGPDVPLKSATVQIFALGLHELTTNALKYGALSSNGGTLRVCWEICEDEAGRRLHLLWDEQGVACLEAGPSERRGYGRELIERALPYQLGARTIYTLRPTGVRCEIDAPLDD